MAEHHLDSPTGRTGFEETAPHAAIPVGEAFKLLSFQKSYEHRRIKLDSFSSLHQKMFELDEAREEDVSFQTEQREKEDDEAFASLRMEAVSGEGDLDEVPGGIDVGLMFHDILEHIDYGVVLKAITHNRDPLLSLMHDEGTGEINFGGRWKRMGLMSDGKILCAGS